MWRAGKTLAYIAETARKRNGLLKSAVREIVFGVRG